VTVIAYRNGVLAADSRYTDDDGSPAECEKLFRVGKMLVGFAGESGPTLRLLRAIQSPGRGYPHDTFVGGYALAFCPRRGLMLFDQHHEPETLRAPYFALGSGAQAALGAMHAGATAVQAVHAAIRHQVACGLPVKWMRAVVRKKKR